MQSLQRLTASVLSRSWHLPALRGAPLLLARSSGSLSGLETSYGQEPDKQSNEARTAPKKGENRKMDADHPFEMNETPGALRPQGSNSEEAVAGERSSIDPLSEVKKRRAPKGNRKQEVQGMSSMTKEGSKARAPSLKEVDDDEDLVRGGPSSGP